MKSTHVWLFVTVFAASLGFAGAVRAEDFGCLEDVPSVRGEFRSRDAVFTGSVIAASDLKNLEQDDYGPGVYASTDLLVLTDKRYKGDVRRIERLIDFSVITYCEGEDDDYSRGCTLENPLAPGDWHGEVAMLLDWDEANAKFGADEFLQLCTNSTYWGDDVARVKKALRFVRNAKAQDPIDGARDDIFTAGIARGSTGDTVAALQEVLVHWNFLDMPQGVKPGYFGPLTEAALKKFQTAVGIEATGVVGAETATLLSLSA